MNNHTEFRFIGVSGALILFFLTTAPGFPSRNLANALAAPDGVEISFPNWWQQITPQ